MFINDEAQKQVLPILARTTVAPATESQERAGALLQLNPGQQVKAEIIANLPNNLFLARIAGKLYKLEIPLNIQPGETLEMSFVAAEPRVTFQVLRQAGGGASVQLTSMGKWLATVLGEATPPAPPAEPLLQDPAQGAALLATRLKESVTRSGLFYESHLAQWAAGGGELKELLKEPQGKLSPAATGAAPEAHDAGPADARTLPLIREQLVLMNSGVFNWRGEAWPGQGMELTVTEGEEDASEPGLEAALSLQLPHLGGIRAALRFTGEGLAVEFVCEKQGMSEVLKEGGDQLRSALLSAGLHLNRMAARDGEESG